MPGTYVTCCSRIYNPTRYIFIFYLSTSTLFAYCLDSFLLYVSSAPNSFSLNVPLIYTSLLVRCHSSNRLVSTTLTVCSSIHFRASKAVTEVSKDWRLLSHIVTIQCSEKVYPIASQVYQIWFSYPYIEFESTHFPHDSYTSTGVISKYSM